MRQKVARYGAIFVCTMLVLSLFVAATEDGMVMIYMVLALICVIPCVAATTSSMRTVTFGTLVLAIVMALFNWNIAVRHWRRYSQDLRDRLAEVRAKSESSASHATSLPGQ
jgi:hypothetical protein